MAIREIMNVASAEQEMEEALEAEGNYQSGLFGMTAQELKQAKRDETMDMLRFGQGLGLTSGQIGAGMLLGQAARALTGKGDPRELELEQREANRAAFLEQLKGASNQELIDLGTKAMLSEDDETRSFGYQLFGSGRAGLAAELAASKKAGEFNPKNSTEQDVNVSVGVLKAMGYKSADIGVGSAVAAEFRRLQELNRDDPEWQSKPMVEHLKVIINDFADRDYLKVGSGGFAYFSDQAKIGLGNEGTGTPDPEITVRQDQRKTAMQQYPMVRK